MGKPLRFVSLPNLHRLLEGLAIDVPRCAEVLDHMLCGFDRMPGGIPSRIVAWNAKSPDRRGHLSFPCKGCIIAQVTQTVDDRGRVMHMSKLLTDSREPEAAPAVFVETHSPSLDVPMRTEIPMRAVLKGGPRLDGTYTVYLHALCCENGADFVYYGITRRGWNARFAEHAIAAIREESRRLFPSKLRELIGNRLGQLEGLPRNGSALSGIVTTICAVGLSEDAALDAEEYLVDKYSLSGKHANGLNMIPGGREGIRCLATLYPGTRAGAVDTEDREAALDGYLRDHPALGRPNPGVAAAWDDPAYCEAVVCGRENRLSAAQVRKIRFLAALGSGVDEIRAQVGALDAGQVSRVLQGRTYSRIR